ncbi:MAG: hypothetical protein MJ078_02715, partial [Clostridia bacterium]|nr:hypothetical protein [Clostridia bacterium]
ADPIKNPFDLFTLPLTLRTLSGFPKTENRKVFTWGHPINDYRQYVENLARVKINEVIVWNDFCPLNAEEMVEYAHSYGIKVVFGYAWGWIAGCSNITDISEKRLAEIQAEAVKKFETEYAPLHADGIYFQSFTERGDRFIGGRNIAEAVTALVNGTGRELLDKYPSLQIEFGLHRQSVAEDLEEIAKVDPRVEIVWENGDCFPMCSEPDCADETLWEKEVSVLKKLIHLRNNGKTSFLYKGFATLDWNGNRFVYQRGPYIMGDSRPDLQGEDTLLRRNRWRYLSGQWAEKGDFAQRMTRFIQKESKGNAGLGMAALLDDGVWLPELLAANMIYNADEDFTFNLRKSLTSPCVEW